MRIRSMRERRDNRKYLRLRSDEIIDATNAMKNSPAYKKVEKILIGEYYPAIVAMREGTLKVSLKPFDHSFPKLVCDQKGKLWVKNDGDFLDYKEAKGYWYALESLLEAIEYLEKAPREDFFEY